MSVELTQEEIDELLDIGTAAVEAALTDIEHNNDGLPIKHQSQDNKSSVPNSGTDTDSTPSKGEKAKQKDRKKAKDKQKTSTKGTSSKKTKVVFIDETTKKEKKTVALNLISDQPQTGQLLTGPAIDNKANITSIGESSIYSDSKQKLLIDTSISFKATKINKSDLESVEFKRGFSETGACSNEVPREGGHRREYTISWVGGKTTVLEWCNPRCAPVRPTATIDQCKCGKCPKWCELCTGDL
ncbi:V protein [Wufeng Rhinolophus sinicus rubulavirus 1]|uniref:V protein n=1 Tax=Wufeng Rhinolophus sinicus rubulavirus 1 TaxID=2877512 RepID=A0AAE9BV90_9MONO|nr:V protein [Wufeng Rhinolophus sinicus rubulavirus 1]